jgi:hypothetical protein
MFLCTTNPLLSPGEGHLILCGLKEMNGVTLPFTYLGEVNYASSHSDQPMSITWRLHTAVPDDLFAD